MTIVLPTRNLVIYEKLDKLQKFIQTTILFLFQFLFPCKENENDKIFASFGHTHYIQIKS